MGSAIAILLIIGVVVFLLKRRRDGSQGTIYINFTNMYIYPRFENYSNFWLVKTPGINKSKLITRAYAYRDNFSCPSPITIYFGWWCSFGPIIWRSHFSVGSFCMNLKKITDHNIVVKDKLLHQGYCFITWLVSKCITAITISCIHTISRAEILTKRLPWRSN